MKKPQLGQRLAENFSVGTMSFQEFVEATSFSRRTPSASAPARPQYTGRYLVTSPTPDPNVAGFKRLLVERAGMRMAVSSDFGDTPITEDRLGDATALLYEGMGVALVDGDGDQLIQMREAAGADLLVEPELIAYVPDDVLLAQLIATTWGLTMLGSPVCTGRGVKVAVLDTGFDTNHPDFAGRRVVAQSFVPNEAPTDGHGHGTHCIGTACGGKDVNGIRYGVASDCDIYAGKVLSNAGSGAQSWILSGIQWAIQNGCRVISMSLGSPVWPGQGISAAYERAGQYARSRGAIIVAAAGNESNRAMGVIQPVGSPANCPSILAVGAIDVQQQIANFSCRGINPGQEVDVAAPGVSIYSSWPSPVRYKTISGTSMATPHVAGILALFAELYPGATADELVAYMTSAAKPMTLTPTMTAQDVGNGLAQAQCAPAPTA